jgi:hypothetical protein
MAEKLVFDVLARASGAADVKKIGAALDDVGKAADKLDGKSSGGGFFAKFTSQAKSAASSVGGTFDKLTADLQAHGKKGGDGFGAGLIGGFTGVFGKIGQTAVEAGTKIGGSLTSGISSSLAATGPAAPVLFGALIAAAPPAGAAIAGALLAGISAASLGGGIAMALRDPAVLREAGSLGTDIMRTLTAATEGFKGPVVEAIGVFRNQWAAASGDVTRFFANTQGLVAPLAKSFGEAGQSLIKGLADASETAGPILTALGEGVKLIGETLGGAFSSLKDNGAAAATAISLSFQVIAATLAGLFGTIDLLTQAFGFLAKSGVLGPSVFMEYQRFQGEMERTKGSIDATTAALKTQGSEMTNLSNQLKAATDPAFALIDAQQKLNTAQQNVVKATREHGAASTQVKDANLEAAKAALQMQTAAEKAGGAFNGVMTPALRATLEAAGMTQAQIAQVESQLTTAAQAGKNFGKRYEANIALLGLGGVQAAAGAAKRAIDAIPSSKTITINAVGSGLAVARAEGGIDKKMAQGGVMSHFVSSPTVLYGERGDEAYIAKDANKARSRLIAEQVVENWLGGKVSWGGGQTARKGGASAGGAGGGGAGNSEILGALHRLIAATERGGNVYLDQRLVGSIQGREADLFERAG